MTAHREEIKAYLDTLDLKDALIIDWGSGAKPVSRYTTHENCEFITVDKNPLIDTERRSPSHRQWDIQHPISLPKADIAFCIEVLEHTEQPKEVLKTINSNLKDGGTLYFTAPFQFPIHSDDDYWRYTEPGIRLLLGWTGFTVKSITPLDKDSGYIVEATK